MAKLKLEFYNNGRIKSYTVSSIWMSFKDRISYNQKDGFTEDEKDTK